LTDRGKVANDTLTITDNRTGKNYEVPITDETIRAMDLRQIKVNDDDFGLMTYDPGFTNTAATRSAVTFIDGDKGILRYRGYPIEQLAEQSSFLEVAYLLLRGELPTQPELDAWAHGVIHHTFLHENIRKLMDGFRYDAHPMGVFVSTVAALSTFYVDAKSIHDPESRAHQIERLVAKTPTIAAFAYRHMMGLPYVYPDNDLSYSGNLLNMMFRTSDKFEPNPVLERALDVLFILHGDHEQNCSANAMRSVGSSELVLRMLREIGDVKHIPAYMERVKKREVRLMGFGHRVYKNYDPRAKVIKEIAYQVFEVTGKNPVIDIALELERIALDDEFFVERKLYPNVDFYSGIIYEAMQFPVAMFPVLFAIGRTPGWLAQWQELLEDDDQRIARPRQIYTGSGSRDYVEMGKR
jgi:citrate synthase